MCSQTVTARLAPVKVRDLLYAYGAVAIHRDNLNVVDRAARSSPSRFSSFVAGKRKRAAVCTKRIACRDVIHPCILTVGLPAGACQPIVPCQAVMWARRGCCRRWGDIEGVHRSRSERVIERVNERLRAGVVGRSDAGPELVHDIADCDPSLWICEPDGSARAPVSEC
jgi:hypothetical protein